MLCKIPNDGNSCLRLRNPNGKYLSLLPCGVDGENNVNCVDLCLPNGEVLYCGIDIALVNILVENLGLETIS